MRRFKDGDTYLYPEMCDLFSHVYQQHSSMNGSYAPVTSTFRKTSMDFTSLKTFFETARAKQNQWRRFVFPLFCVFIGLYLISNILYVHLHFYFLSFLIYFNSPRTEP